MSISALDAMPKQQPQALKTILSKTFQYHDAANPPAVKMKISEMFGGLETVTTNPNLLNRHKSVLNIYASLLDSKGTAFSHLPGSIRADKERI